MVRVASERLRVLEVDSGDVVIQKVVALFQGEMNTDAIDLYGRGHNLGGRHYPLSVNIHVS